MRAAAIVVGTDGTDPGIAAVRWAAREAQRRRLPLRIIHVLDRDWAATRYDFSGERFDTARQTTRLVVQEAARQVDTVAPDVEVSAQISIGRPVARLLDSSVGAAQLVIGDRDRGGLTGLLLGSVSRRVAARAHCPVVVVRGRSDPGPGPVATEVDHPDTADTVLGCAFAAAADRNATLVVVRSYLPTPAADPDTPDSETVARDDLSQRLLPWQSKYPQVTVETLLSEDSSAATLAEISHGTQLIVVGSGGHGPFGGTQLGSTAVQLLHHADCPVLVTQS